MVAALAAAALACTPHPGLGTVEVARGAVTHIVDLADCRERTVRTQRPQGSLASPDGRFRATVRANGRGRARRNTIVVAGRPVYSARAEGDTTGLDSPGPIDLLGWSGDDRWIFFAIDPGASGSIAADGLVLRAVPRSGGLAYRLGTMLPYRDYLAWCGGRLVFTGGGDRIASSGKRLLVASPPTWRVRSLVVAPGRAWGSLACAPGGRAVVVESQPQNNSGSFFATRWSLWRVGLDSSSTRLTSPPVGYADDSPRFSRDGRTLYFVRSRKGRGRLYALRGNRVLGPLLSLGYELGYYGHRDWPYGVRPA